VRHPVVEFGVTAFRVGPVDLVTQFNGIWLQRFVHWRFIGKWVRHLPTWEAGVRLCPVLHWRGEITGAEF